MPRRTPVGATTRVDKAQEAHWRYVLRNPNFRADLFRLHEMRANPFRTAKELTKRDREQSRVTRKWGLALIPRGVTGYLLTRRNPHDYAPAEALWEWTQELPVSVVKLEEGRYLWFWVDVTYPVDDILPLVEAQLRRLAREQRGRRARRRLTAVHRHLKVFDLHEAGYTFRAISMKLRRPPSTVRSAYLVARRRVLGAGTGSAEEIHAAGFDAEAHAKKCARCRQAQRFEALCPDARAYADQDQRGQQDLTGYDTTRG